MSDGHSFGDRWREARPSKAMLFWSCAGCAVATMIIGFTWGGWVTGGTAQEMAAEAATGARAELAAAVCVDRFLNSPDAAGQLAQLRDTSAWQRDSFIEDGGWVTLAGMEDPVDEAADLCADQLLEADAPAPTPETETAPS